MAIFIKNKIPYTYFRNLVPEMNESCEQGLKELQGSLRQIRIENALVETGDVLELAILEVLLNSLTFCVTEEDLLRQVWSYLSAPVLYCTPNLKVRLKQTLKKSPNIITVKRHIFYVRNEATCHLDLFSLRTEIFDEIARFTERARYQDENLTNNPEREQFQLSIACMKILVYAEQNTMKSATASLQRCIDWLQKKTNKISESIVSLLDSTPTSWTTDTVLKLHVIHSAIQSRKSSMFKLQLNVPLPTFSTAIYPPIGSML